MASPRSSEMLRNMMARPGGVWSPPTIEYLAKKGGREPRAARTLAREPEWAMQLRGEDGHGEQQDAGRRISPPPSSRRSGEHGGSIPRDGAPPSNLFEVLQSRMFYLPHTHGPEPEADPSRPVHARYCCGIFADYIFPNDILRHGVYEGSYGQLVGDLKDLMQTLRRMCKKVQEKEVPPFVPPKELPLPMPTHVNMEILPLFVPPTLKELPEDPNLPPLDIAPFKPPRKIPLPIFVPPPEIKAKPFLADRPEGDEWDFLPEVDEDALWKLRPQKPEAEPFCPPPARPIPEFHVESINLRDMPRKPHFEPLPDAAALVQHLLKEMPPKLNPTLLPLPCAAEYYVCDEDEASAHCDGMCGRPACNGSCRPGDPGASGFGYGVVGDDGRSSVADDSDGGDAEAVAYACGYGHGNDSSARHGSDVSGRRESPHGSVGHGRAERYVERAHTPPPPPPTSRQREAVAQVDRLLAEKNASINLSAEMIKQRVRSFVQAETRHGGGGGEDKDGRARTPDGSSQHNGGDLGPFNAPAAQDAGSRGLASEGGSRVRRGSVGPDSGRQSPWHDVLKERDTGESIREKEGQGEGVDAGPKGASSGSKGANSGLRGSLRACELCADGTRHGEEAHADGARAVAGGSGSGPGQPASPAEEACLEATLRPISRGVDSGDRASVGPVDSSDAGSRRANATASENGGRASVPPPARVAATDGDGEGEGAGAVTARRHSIGSSAAYKASADAAVMSASRDASIAASAGTGITANTKMVANTDSSSKHGSNEGVAASSKVGSKNKGGDASTTPRANSNAGAASNEDTVADDMDLYGNAVSKISDRPLGGMRPRSSTAPSGGMEQAQRTAVVFDPRPRSPSGSPVSGGGAVTDEGSPRRSDSASPPASGAQEEVLRRFSAGRSRSASRQRPDDANRARSFRAGGMGDRGSGSGGGSSDDGARRSPRVRSGLVHGWEGPTGPFALASSQDDDNGGGGREGGSSRKVPGMKQLNLATANGAKRGSSVRRRPNSACGCFTPCITPRATVTQFPAPPMPTPEELEPLPMPVLQTPELLPVPEYSPPEPAPVPEVPLPEMEPVPAFERLAPPPPLGFLGGKCPVFVLDGSSSMSAEFLMTFIDCILSPGGQLDICATHFDVILYNKHAWSCHTALVKSKQLDPPEPGGNDLMPITRRNKSLMIEWLRSFSMVGSAAMHLGVQLGYSLRSADCFYMLTEGSALRPAAVFDVINSCDKKRPIFPLLLSDGRKEERFMEEIAALTGGKVKMFEKERFTKMYTDYLAALGELPDPIKWIHERVVDELRANKENGVFEPLATLQDRLEPEFNAKWAEPIVKRNAEKVERWHEEQDKAITEWGAEEVAKRAAALSAHYEAVEAAEAENAARQAEALYAHSKAKEEVRMENEKRSNRMVKWHEAAAKAEQDRAAERADGMARYEAEVARVQAENAAILAAAHEAWEQECREVSEYNKALLEKKKAALEGDIRRVKRFNEDLEEAYQRRCAKVKAKNERFIAEAKAEHERWCREIVEDNERVEATARMSYEARVEHARVAYQQKMSRWEAKLESTRDRKLWSSESRWEAMYEIPERNRAAREAARLAWATECHAIEAANEAALREAEKEYALYKEDRMGENARRRAAMDAYVAAVDAVTEENNRIMRKAEKRYQATCDRINASNEHRRETAAQSDVLAEQRVKEMNAANHAAAYEEYLASIEDLVKHNKIQQIRQLKNNYLMNELKRVEAFLTVVLAHPGDRDNRICEMSLIADALATANDAAPPVATEGHTEGGPPRSPAAQTWRMDEDGNFRRRHRDHGWEGRPTTPGSTTSRTFASDSRHGFGTGSGWGEDAHGAESASGVASPVHSACASPSATPGSARVGPILATPMIPPKRDPPVYSHVSTEGGESGSSPLGSPVGQSWPSSHRGGGGSCHWHR